MVARWSAPTTTPPLNVIPTVLVPVFMTFCCSDMIPSLPRHFLNLEASRNQSQVEHPHPQTPPEYRKPKKGLRGVLKNPRLIGCPCGGEKESNPTKPSRHSTVLLYHNNVHLPLKKKPLSLRCPIWMFSRRQKPRLTAGQKKHVPLQEKARPMHRVHLPCPVQENTLRDRSLPTP